MSAHTLGTINNSSNFVSGLNLIQGTFTGTASYDTGGSVLDMSSQLKSTCRFLEAYDDTGLYKLVYDNATSDAAATGKVKIFYNQPASTSVTMAHDGVCFDAAQIVIPFSPSPPIVYW
jgi:hypothetical protein